MIGVGISMAKRIRIKTGIDGVDELIEGGMPEYSQVLLAGGPGSGKTLMCFEYLYKSAHNGDTAILFSFEEDTKNIVANAKDAFTEFTDIDELIESKKLIIYGSEMSRAYMSRGEEKPRFAFSEMLTQLESLVASSGALRIAIDSISVIKLFIRDAFEYRDLSVSLISMLKRLKVTSIITMEMATPEKSSLIFEPEFFIYDGLIVMYSTGGSESRTPAIEVIKMRGSAHSFATVPYEITSGGINLLVLAGRSNRSR